MEQLTKKLRAYIWLLSGLLHRHYRIILSTFIIGVFVFILFVRYTAQVIRLVKKERQIIGMVGQFTPTSLPQEVQRLISLGLTDVRENGEVVPALATAWETSKDGKEVTFHLRQDLYWHDQKKFVASDVNYNLRDVEFKAPDDVTLIVILKDAFTPLPNFLSRPLFRKGLLGLGSYKLISIRLKGEYVAYLKLTPLSSDLGPMEIKFYQSETAAKTAFKLGEINILDGVIDASPFNEWNNINVVETVKYNQIVGVFFNTNDDLLKDKEVRQGLAFAVEKFEKNRVASPLSSKSWAYTTRIKQYDNDPKAAKNLLGEQPAGGGAELTLITFPQYFPLAQRIAASWEEVGFKTNVKVESGLPQDYQVVLVTQEIPSDPDQYALWHSTQTQTNLSHYANPKIDKLLEDGRKEAELEKRKKIYFDFQRYLVEDAPAVFLFHPTTYTISRK